MKQLIMPSTTDDRAFLEPYVLSMFERWKARQTNPNAIYTLYRWYVSDGVNFFKVMLEIIEDEIEA